MKLKLQLNLEDMPENFEYNYHINELENSYDQVLRFHSRSIDVEQAQNS